MKIKRALDGKPFTRRIKVGAKDGSAFFYCGTVEDFRISLEEYSTICEANAKCIVQEAHKRLESCINNPPTIERFVRMELKSEKPNLSLANYQMYISAYLRKVDRLTAAVENAQQKLDGFEPLFRREVVEMYDSDPVADPDCTILIISGYENGAYWMTAESVEKGSRILFSNGFTEEED